MALSSSAVTTSAAGFPLQAPDYDEMECLSETSRWPASQGGQSPYDFEDQPHECSNYQVYSSYQPNPQPMFNYGSQLRGPDQQQLTGGYHFPQYTYNTDPNCPRSCYSGIDPAAYQMSMSKQQDLCPPNHCFAEGMEDVSYSHGIGLPHGHSLMHDGYHPMHHSPFSDPMDHSVKLEYLQPLDEERSASEPIQDEVNPEKEPPYAKLIYKALMQSPGYTMVLKDIYAWFKENTDKATDKETKGWQNSIRHNLSMNGAFKKVEQPAGEDSKKGNMWMLTDEAIREGVKSTTRYRTKNTKPRSTKAMQAPSAKGGHTARKVARQRRPERGIFDSGLTPDICLPLGDAYDPAEIDYSAGLTDDIKAEGLLQPQGLLHDYPYRFEAGPCRFFGRGRLPAAPTSAGIITPYPPPHAHSSPESDEQYYVDNYSAPPVNNPFSTSPESDDGPTTPPSSDFDRVSIHDQDMDMHGFVAGPFFEANSTM